MAKIRTLAAMLLATMLISTVTVTTVAQTEAASPEGVDWQLTQYASDGSLTDVPAGVTPTLLLGSGQATGNGGCNSFFGSYQLEDATITFDENFGRTEMFCEGDPQIVEDAYLATLPTVAAWSVEAGMLQLSDANDATVLVYDSAGQGDIDRVLALLDALQAQIAAMDARIVSLEGNGGATADPLKKPKAPTARGGKVKTVFPDWFKDEFRPEAERSDDKDRELVRWRNRAPDADGVRVYARRAFCALKEGADPSQELKKKDFEVAKGPAQLIVDLPAGSKRYRPRHDGIDAALPAAPETEYSADQFYDVLVQAYNSAGSSKRNLVASFYLTPEFSCP